MAQNTGTLVGSAIRPIYDNLPIASAYGNEVKGGHHVYATRQEMLDIIEPRRDWGMLVTVYNDPTPSNNRTYTLKYNFQNTNIMDNDNWVYFSPIDEPLNNEWLDSVSSIEDQQPVSPVDGQRVLVSNNPLGVFASHANKLAVYSLALTDWKYYSPSLGWTVRVDNIPNTLFKFDGTNWKRELLNTVRYFEATSNDGLYYEMITGSASGQYQINIDTLDSYSYSVMYVNFGATNTGPVTVKVDSLPTTGLKKFSNGSLVDLALNDLLPGIEYQVIWNSTSNVLQTSPPAETVTKIGPAEDGDYTDGLYTDFTPTTPIGTAVDRFNEVLKALAPASAPSLNAYSYTPTTNFTSGGLSFDNSNGISSGTASPSPVARGQNFLENTGNFGTVPLSPGYHRLGITSKVLQPRTNTQYYNDITGTLNSSTVVSPTTPTPAYVANSFGNAMTGTMSLRINGTVVSSVGLATFSALNTTVGNTQDGLILSAATSSKFAGGAAFDSFMNRTGTYLIKAGSSNIVRGYNYFEVIHTLSPSSEIVLHRKEFVADQSTAEVTTPTTPRITSVIGNTKKFISGIEFWDIPLSFKYETTLGNLVGDTYYHLVDGLSFTDASDSTTNNPLGYTTINATPPPGISSPTIANYAIPTASISSPSSNIPVSMTFSVGSQKRRINDDLKFRMQVKRTVQGTFTGATVTNDGSVKKDGWFIDTYVSGTTTALVESFANELYRLLNDSSKYSTPYSYVTTGLASNWNNTKSLYSDPGYTNALQVINGSLMYPRLDFSSYGDLVTNPNSGLVNRQYNNCSSVNAGYPATFPGSSTNYRSFTRYLFFGNTSQKKTFTLSIRWEGVNWVNSNVPLTGNNCWLELRIPYLSGATIPLGTSIETTQQSTTGWMDATKPFNGSSWTDGSGCYSASLSSGTPLTTSFNGTTNRFGIDFGSRGLVTATGYIFIRITAGPNWAGRITEITIA